jgi:autotransporter adhesin
MKKATLALILGVFISHYSWADETSYEVTGNNGKFTLVADTLGGNTVSGLAGVYNLDQFDIDVKRNARVLLATEAGVSANQAAIASLGQDVLGVQNTGVYARSRADAAMANAEANKAALQATNQAMAENTAELANHESRIDALEANTVNSSSFNRLKDRVDENRQRASAGIAGVAAMANIPQVTQGATFSVGAGAGTTDGESALAVGFSARATESTVVKASVSNDSQQNFVVGAGASLQW